MSESPENFEERVQDAIANPQNMGEMADADAVGTVGSSDCGDMVRMFLKFSEKDGEKVIDRASFQSFGCQTAIAVASMATEMLKGKTAAEASAISAEEMSEDLGALPPMKIHCGQMVEGALKEALGDQTSGASLPLGGTTSGASLPLGGATSGDTTSGASLPPGGAEGRTEDKGALAGSLVTNAPKGGKIKIVPLEED